MDAYEMEQRRIAIRQAMEFDRERSRMMRTAKRQLDVVQAVVRTKSSPFHKDLVDDLAVSEVATLVREAETFHSRTALTSTSNRMMSDLAAAVADDAEMPIAILRRRKVLLEQQERKLRALLQTQRSMATSVAHVYGPQIEAKRRATAAKAERRKVMKEAADVERQHVINRARIRAGLNVVGIDGDRPVSRGSVAGDGGARRVSRGDRESVMTDGMRSSYTDAALGDQEGWGHTDELGHGGAESYEEGYPGEPASRVGGAGVSAGTNWGTGGTSIPRGTPALPHPSATGKLSSVGGAAPREPDTSYSVSTSTSGRVSALPYGGQNTLANFEHSYRRGAPMMHGGPDSEGFVTMDAPPPEELRALQHLPLYTPMHMHAPQQSGPGLEYTGAEYQHLPHDAGFPVGEAYHPGVASMARAPAHVYQRYYSPALHPSLQHLGPEEGSSARGPYALPPGYMIAPYGYSGVHALDPGYYYGPPSGSMSDAPLDTSHSPPHLPSTRSSSGRESGHTTHLPLMSPLINPRPRAPPSAVGSTALSNASSSHEAGFAAESVPAFMPALNPPSSPSLMARPQSTHTAQSPGADVGITKDVRASPFASISSAPRTDDQLHEPSVEDPLDAQNSLISASSSYYY